MDLSKLSGNTQANLYEVCVVCIRLTFAVALLYFRRIFPV